MDAQDYEAWYHTTRGRWIGDVEFDLLKRMLRLEKGESLLDVGCGTGYFTRRFAAESELRVVGLDPNLTWWSLRGPATGRKQTIVQAERRACHFPRAASTGR